jgi:hypothetical protein
MLTDKQYFDAAMLSIHEEIKALEDSDPICPKCDKPAAVIILNGSLLDCTLAAFCDVHGVIKPIGE